MNDSMLVGRPALSDESAEAIDRVAVVGAGTMGRGIAQVVAVAGLGVTLIDVDDAVLSSAQAQIDERLARLVGSHRLTQEAASGARARIQASSDLDGAAATADHVIEAVVEDISVKEEILGRLDERCPPHAILASNTSQFSISRLAAATGRPDRVVGSHWFHPAPAMDLIEVVRGIDTSEETVQVTLALARRYGKQTVICRKDSPGFITSRLIAILALEAMRILEEGVADADDINRACRLAFNHAMGPLDTVDYSGLDTTLKVADALTKSFGERFLAPQSIRRLVHAGHVGRKSGRGFSDYHAQP